MPEILFVDPAVDHAETLTDSVRSGIQVLALPEVGDALVAIARALTGRRDVAALHILSHGAPGALQLSGTTVDLDVLASRPTLIAAIRAALADDAEIVLYGCSVVEEAAGAAFVEGLSELLGCPVAAADAPVGGAALGGIWPVPVRSDSAFSRAAREAYPGLLPVFTFGTVTTVNTTTTLTSEESGVTVSVTSSDGQRWASVGGLDGNAVATPGVVNSGTILTFSFSSSVNVTGFQILQSDADASTGGGIIGRGFLSGATVGTQVSAVTADISTGNAGANVYNFSPGDWSGINAFTITNTGDGASDATWRMFVDSISFSVAGPAAPAAPNLIASSDTGSNSTDNITLNALPTIDGTAVAGNGVHILVGGVTVGSTTADGSGNWTFTFTSTLSAGTNVITAVQDTGSAESAASTALNVVVDTSAGTLSTPDLDAASDSGADNTDNVTTTANPKIQGGGAEAGATVHIIDDGVTVGSTTATGTGTWSFTFTTSLSEGTNAITVVQTDVAGNSSGASTALNVVLDTTAPTTLGTPDLLAVSDTGISSTDNETSSVTQQLTGSATTGDIVSILVGGTTANIVTAVGNSWSYIHTLTAGSYAITVQATDLAGNTGPVSTALGLTIDTVSPGTAGTPDLLTSSDSGSNTTDNITNVALPTISGSGAVANGLVQILVGGVTVGTTTASSVGAWTFTFTSTLSAGTHAITAATQDVAGNQGPVSAALNVVVDTSAATLSAPDLDAASDSGADNTDNITATANPKIQGAGADAGATVHVIDDGVTVGSTTATGTGSWSFTFTTSLSEGSNAITVVQTDLAGNTGTASSALGITVDTTAPVTLGTPDLLAVSDTGISSTDNETSSVTQQLTGSATTGDIVSILVGGTTANIVTAAGNSWSYTHTLTAGVYAITVQATDLAGNAGPVSTALGLTIDTTSPATIASADLLASSDSGTSNTDNITNVSLPTISGSGAVANGLVQILVGGVTVGATTVSGVGAWTFTFTSTLSAGTNVITVAAQDVAGNQGPASAALNVTVDTSAATLSTPDLDAASDSGADNTDNITATANPKIQGDGADAGATVHIIDDGVTVGSVTATGTGSWSFTFTTSLSEGTNAITVVQTDVAGNSSGASTALNVVLDTTAPTTLGLPDLLAASDLGVSSTDNITSATTQQFSGSASDGDRVHLIVNAVTTATVVTAGGSWTHTTSLSSGSYSISVSVTDAVGNVGPASAVLGVVVDLVAPIGTVGTPDLLASSDLGTSSTDNLTSTAVPTIAGDGGEANNFVQILVDGVTVGATTASGAGAWTFTFSASLSSGTHIITARSQDVAGNVGPSSTALNVVIDLTAPAAPGTLATPDLVAASDTGTSSTDNLTTDATPSFSGTNTTGSTVHALLANGVTVGMFTSDAGGTYNVTASSLTAGSYAITIRELDSAGNASTSSPALGITIETEPAPSTGGGGSGSSGGGTTTTTTTTTTTNPTTGATTTTQTQTVQNTSSNSTASAAIVENTNNNGNVVTATLPAQTSITSEGPTTAQSRDDALTTLITAVDARNSTGESKLITGAQAFLNKLSSTTTLDVRTIIPTTTSTSLSSPIVITGTSAASGSTQSEAFVIDVRSLPSGTTLQLDNIEFASIIGSATVNGGSGDNYAVGDDSDQFISLGEGDDTLFGGEGNDTIGSASGDDSLGGDEGDDRVFGGTGNDTAFGDAGADAVYGNQENDVLYGNLNNDTIYGGQDSDTAFGGQDDDVIYGNLAADSLSGQLGDDTIYGGQGDDLVYGGQGEDLLFGNLASDTLSGGAGDDTLSGGADADVLYGGAGNDHLNGGAGQDTLYGGTPGSATGIDVLDGGDGDDVIYGGEGIDWIYSGTGSDAIYVEASNGFDVLVDFDASAGDVIHLATNINGSGIASFSDIQAAAADTADGSVEIALGSNNFVRIVGVTSSQLTSDMFQFF